MLDDLGEFRRASILIRLNPERSFNLVIEKKSFGQKTVIFWENWYKHLPTFGGTLKNVTFWQILNKIGPIYITTSCHTVSYYWSQWVDGIRQDIFPDDPKHPLYVFSFFFCRNKFLAAIKPSFSSIRSPPTTTTMTTTTNIVKADDDLGRRPFYIFFLFHVRTAFRSVLTIIEMIRPCLIRFKRS